MTDSELEVYARGNPVVRVGLAQVQFINEVASQLRTLREQAGLTQKQLGRLMGVSQPRIAQIESGKPEAPASLEQIAAYAFHCARIARIGFEKASPFAHAGESVAAGPVQVAGIKPYGFGRVGPYASGLAPEEQPGVPMADAKALGIE